MSLSDWIDLSQPSLWLSAASIAFNPIFWNSMAQWEFRTKSLTRLAGSPFLGCYVLAFAIFSLGLLRDYFYAQALDQQPISPFLDSFLVQAFALFLFAAGNVFVLSSMWRLGVTGTYLGDYFGILMDDRITSFPFNVMENPMYNGSTMCFIGTALYKASFAGLVLSTWAFVAYTLAMAFEGPFTAFIYSQHKANKGGAQSKKE